MLVASGGSPWSVSNGWTFRPRAVTQKQAQDSFFEVGLPDIGRRPQRASGLLMGSAQQRGEDVPLAFM